MSSRQERFTVPEGVPWSAARLAVKVTLSPGCTGFGDPDMVTVAAAVLPTCCVTAGEALGAEPPPPE